MLDVYKVTNLELEELQNFCKEHNQQVEEEVPFVFIIKEDSKIIGFCEALFNDMADRVIVNNIFITEMQREKGYGELLLKAVLNYLELNQIYYCYASFDDISGDERIKKFFKKLFFKETDETISYFKNMVKSNNYKVNLHGYFDHPCQKKALE